MADYRLFARGICESARFLRLPVSSQCLYLHLMLHADDDGAVEAFGVLRLSNASEDDLNILLQRKFLLPLVEDDLIVLIKDWPTHNTGGYLRSDRRKPSIYRDAIADRYPDYILPTITHRTDRLPRDVPLPSQGRPKGKKGKVINNNIARDYDYTALETYLLTTSAPQQNK